MDVTGAPGATSVAMALLSGPCRSGAWVGLLGMEHLGWAAVSELGLPLQRMVSVDLTHTREDSGTARSAVMAAMIDTFDIVVFGTGNLPGGALLRKLRARARERGSLLVSLRGGVDGADASLDVLGTRWEGLGQGWGRLGGRTVEVQVRGRGALDRPCRGEIRFDARGRPEAIEDEPTTAGHIPEWDVEWGVRDLVS